MTNSGIIELDLHGKNAEEAQAAIDRCLKTAGPQVYRLRLIHGYHGGTRLKSMILEEYSYGRSPRVLRIAPGENQGITTLILREF